MPESQKKFLETALVSASELVQHETLRHTPPVLLISSPLSREILCLDKAYEARGRSQDWRWLRRMRRSFSFSLANGLYAFHLVWGSRVR